MQIGSNMVSMICWFAVVLLCRFTTAKLQIKVSSMGRGFRGVEFRGSKSVVQ